MMNKTREMDRIVRAVKCWFLEPGGCEAFSICKQRFNEAIYNKTLETLQDDTCTGRTVSWEQESFRVS